ncbi:hypothetical protein CBR_g24160 [Chara braunii]|uniref:Ubiquinol oxidase n=1 Tax=Chara braunii TaxID=69332 RepID=A0A388L683_CHABU|nr:hypothetical protein CBR_g24160 [Chara braunii]|eukprot:GBG77713.1 hypothetical protein CBR_g24160 [Chara braunii]
MGFVSVGWKVGSGICREKSASVFWRVPVGGASLNSYHGGGGGAAGGVCNLGESGHAGDGRVHLYHTESGGVSRSDGFGSLYSPRWRVRNGEADGSMKPAAAQAAAAVCPGRASVDKLSCFGNVLRRGGGALTNGSANVGIRDRSDITSVRRSLDAAAAVKNSAGRLFHPRGLEVEPQVSLGFAAQSPGGVLLHVHVRRGLSTCSHSSAGIELNGFVFEPQSGRFCLLPGTTAAFSSSATATAAAGAGVGGRSGGVTGTREAARATVDLARSDSTDLMREDAEKWTAREDHGGKGGIATDTKREIAAVEDAHRVSEWAVQPTKLRRADGTPWPWRCFSPKDAVRYDSDLPVSELTRHHPPQNFGDKLAYYVVKSLRVPTDLFFRKKYGCRAVMLETVAAVPGMVGGMLLHLKSLRRFEHSGGWIRTLISEAENERMHLMTFMEISKPRLWERALVIVTQGVFANAFFLLYVISPRVAHRVVGYLEEEAVVSYTRYLEEIDAGRIENVPAPQIAIDYWALPRDARLRDVVLAVRADEAHHRDVNHFASDIKSVGKQLKDIPAPVDHDK